ncbi:hypothetical protein [Kutzneria sp. 744]|uniref:hypothetical protein n=1 Tax=Kutzneria sp. (strain 744) TaxID=345341 RepID=UPI0012FAFD4D|nr:hypothetical protein [Kutzneria sp. 744]
MVQLDQATAGVWFMKSSEPAPRNSGHIKQLLADRIRLLGADHLDTLFTHANLAHWRERLSDD